MPLLVEPLYEWIKSGLGVFKGENFYENTTLFSYINHFIATRGDSLIFMGLNGRWDIEVLHDEIKWQI